MVYWCEYTHQTELENQAEHPHTYVVMEFPEPKNMHKK